MDALSDATRAQIKVPSVIIRIAGAVLVLACGAAAADSIDTAGQEPYERCGYCHEIDGNSRMEAAPRIAAQPQEYLVKQLRDFRTGRRAGTMQATAELLSDADIDTVARYFNAQSVRLSGPAPLAEQARRTAERLHRHGDHARGIPACGSCHGMKGEGQGRNPRLAGQHAVYLESQLHSFKQGRRANDINGVMRKVASIATEREIQLLARYFAGLGSL